MKFIRAELHNHSTESVRFLWNHWLHTPRKKTSACWP